MGEIRMTRDFFLWCMSATYLFAFASLFVQIPGLYGENGLLPARLVLQKEAQSFEDLFHNQVTLLRLMPRLGLDVETSMDLLCLGGVILSFVALIAKRQRNTIVFALLWAFYFSLFQVGQTFLWFQWDILLLEIGFLTILLAPFNLCGLTRTWYHQHDRIILWLVKWLMFRLMFASGVVKLTSNCPTWWGLTALNYHYETQCIPTPLAWYAHQLPEWLQKLSVASVYVIQIAVPFLFFSPVRSQRIFAFLTQVFLMVLIALTGNYNFFNFVTAVIAISLVDDTFLRWWLGKNTPEDTGEDDAASWPVIGQFWRPIRWTLNILVYGGIIFWFTRLFALQFRRMPLSVEAKIMFDANDLNKFLQKTVPISMWIAALSLAWEILKAVVRSIVEEKGAFQKLRNLTGCTVFGIIAVLMFSVTLVDHTIIENDSYNNLYPVLHRWHQQTSRFELTHSYGLFRRMTGVGGRPEVIIEGSNDPDKDWKEYNFLYKPGPVNGTLPIVAPHQPRLDWQMWFAALGTYDRNPWFVNLAYRLLKNQKEVLELMGDNPFPDCAPKYLRATLYHYYFTRWDKTDKRYSKKDWWTRTKVREYLPIVTLNEPSFVNYLKQTGLYQSGSQPAKTQDKPNWLKRVLLQIRAYVGQAEGFRTCIALLVTGLVLSMFDPALRTVSTKPVQTKG